MRLSRRRGLCAASARPSPHAVLRNCPGAGANSRPVMWTDTLSTHMVHPLAVHALADWGILPLLAQSGCPPIDTYAFDFGAFLSAA